MTSGGPGTPTAQLPVVYKQTGNYLKPILLITELLISMLRFSIIYIYYYIYLRYFSICYPDGV